MTEPADAVVSMERWLCGDEVQVAGGPSDGAVVGWTDDAGNASFVYPEITGYYLTWLSFVARLRPHLREEAVARAKRAVSWLGRVRDGDLPPTRCDLDGRAIDDWRSGATFLFDLAMVLRGLSLAAPMAGPEADDLRVRWLGRVAEDFVDEGDLVPLRAVGTRPLPDRWATRSDRHLAKAAAALLSCPGAPDRLVSAARATLHGSHSTGTDHVEDELHPALYQVEGFLMAGGSEKFAAAQLAGITSVLESIPGERRADVLAQALRAGVVLSARFVPGTPSAQALRSFRAELATHITPRGSLLFRTQGSAHHNSWATMFGHQALVFHDRFETDGALPATWPAALI